MVIIAVVIAVVAIVAGYLVYLYLNAARIPDRTALTVTESYFDEVESASGGEEGEDVSVGGAEADASVVMPALKAGTAYKAITYNIGFGAYDHAFSFFKSKALTARGDKVKGLMSRAESERSVRDNVAAVADAVIGQAPDIILFQEVDRNASRSYHVDELRMIGDAFGAESDGENGGGPFAAAYATNFHTGWLLWPPARPIGEIKDSGIATYSRYRMDSAERVSFPVDESFIGRISDLDRCFTIARLPVEGEGAAAVSGGESSESSTAPGGAGGELVLINVHLSAYEEGAKIRSEQMKKLAGVMKEERKKGNRVIAGGDWNMSFPGSLEAFTGRMKVPEWAKPLSESTLPEGFSLVTADNADVIATCRDTSMPWTPGVSYETILDGFIVSDNLTATAENIDTDYAASDHNPVLLTFTLK